MEKKRFYPPEIIDRIASFADIETRRAMGYPPRRLSRELIENMNDLIGGRLNNKEDPFVHLINRTFKFLRIRIGKAYMLTQHKYTFVSGLPYREVKLWDSYVTNGDQVHQEDHLTGAWSSTIGSPNITMNDYKIYDDHANRYIGNQTIPAAILVDHVFRSMEKREIS
jgi:hypothetical protein